jgi:hypothetical protein
MVSDLLSKDLAIGVVTPWPDGNKWSVAVQTKHWFDNRLEFKRELEAWCDRHFSYPYKIDFIFGDGDPFYSLQMTNQEDVLLFTMQFKAFIR